MDKIERNKIKAFALESGLFVETRRAHKSAWLGDTSQLEALRDKYGFETIKIIIGLCKSLYARKKRVRGRVEGLFQEGQVRFLTLTFNDETLSNTSHATRRRYVSRYLKTQCPIYVANVDYGKKNGREHYHALVVGFIDKKPWEDKYGWISAKKIRRPGKDIEPTCKYVVKLTRHAVKETTGIERIIYSRSVKVNFDEIF